jgi:hypothetical protein
MENHYHLLLQTLEPNLSRAMQWLNVSYSVWFNRRHGRVGHLLQGRFKSVIVEPASWALGLSRYIHLNPVRVRRLGLDKSEQRAQRTGLSAAPVAAQVQERLKRLRQFRWSSFGAYAGYVKTPAWLETHDVLRQGGGRLGEQRARYRSYVEAAVREGSAERPWDGLLGRLALGSRDFLAGLTETEDKWEKARREAVLAVRPGLQRVIGAVERVKGEPWAAFRDRHGDTGRDLVLYLGKEKCALKLRELAEAVGAANAMSVSVAVKRYGARLEREKELQEELAKVDKELCKC